MSSRQSRSNFVARRGELMAELFLQEFGPAFLSRPTSADVGYDLLVGFKNKRGGINTFAVEVRATERAPGARLQLPRDQFDRLARSNIPGLLLVADVKDTRMYYGWFSRKHANASARVAIPLTEVNGVTKRELQKLFEAVEDDVAVVR